MLHTGPSDGRQISTAGDQHLSLFEVTSRLVGSLQALKITTTSRSQRTHSLRTRKEGRELTFTISRPHWELLF
jgi:hypothetical protein